MRPLFFLIFVLVCLSSSSQSISQKSNYEFGNVTGQELTMKQYDKEPDAVAVVLFDIGKADFRQRDNDFVILFNRTKRIKIFKKEAYDINEEYNLADIEIPFYRGDRLSEEIRNIKAFTYNVENGQVIKTELEKSAVYTEKISDHWSKKVFPMAGVKEGSIIEYTYDLVSPFKFNLPDWEFQSEIPTIYSEYEAKLVPFYAYTLILQGARSFDQQGSFEERGVKDKFASVKYNKMVHQFVMKDVPSFKDEGYITSKDDYIVKLDFQLSQITHLNGSKTEVITTWDKLAGQLSSHVNFGKYLKTSEKQARKILSENPSLSNPKEIIEYVKRSFKWNEYTRKYSEQSVKDLLRTKNGSSAEINLFLAGMLNAAGVTSYPVLISTRDHGKVYEEYPFENFFNQVVVMVETDKGLFLTDATDPLCPYNLIPEECLNEKGLILKGKNAEWVEINSRASNEVHLMITDINLDDESIQTQNMIQLDGYQALRMRESYYDNVNALTQAMADDQSEVSDLTTKNYNNLEANYQIRYNEELPLEKFGDKIVINPFHNKSLSQNPFKAKTRNHPVDFVFPQKYTLNNTIKIPNGFQIDELPPGYKLSNDIVEVDFQVKILGQTISLSANYEFKKSLYSKNEYKDLRSYVNLIINKLNKNIVLVQSEVDNSSGQ